MELLCLGMVEVFGVWLLGLGKVYEAQSCIKLRSEEK